MIHIIFVCLGNICRSPMAEAVFRKQVEQAGLREQIAVDSAGTSSTHVGEQAHRGTRNILQKHNITYRGRSRQLTHRDLSDYDYILAMDRSNLRNIEHVRGDDRDNTVALFLSYANEAGLTNVIEVPDPYYDGRFDDVYDLVEKGCQALLDHIRATHNI